MAIMQVAVVAFLGVTETPGRSAVKPQNETPDGSLSEGADKGKDVMVIFIVRTPFQNGTSRNISMRQRSERWFHLDRSYGRGVMR